MRSLSLLLGVSALLSAVLAVPFQLASDDDVNALQDAYNKDLLGLDCDVCDRPLDHSGDSEGSHHDCHPCDLSGYPLEIVSTCFNASRPCCCAKIVSGANASLQQFVAAINAGDYYGSVASYAWDGVLSFGFPVTPYVRGRPGIYALYESFTSVFNLTLNGSGFSFKAFCPDVVIAYGTYNITLSPLAGGPPQTVLAQSEITLVPNLWCKPGGYAWVKTLETTVLQGLN